MRDQMQVGDLAFFYHSSCAEPGIAGIVKVTKAAYPDKTQFDKKSPYYDPKATPDAPRWVNVEVGVVGLTAGLLGVGGGMTMIPLLTLIFRYEHFPADVFLVDDRCHRDGQLAE